MADSESEPDTSYGSCEEDVAVSVYADVDLDVDMGMEVDIDVDTTDAVTVGEDDYKQPMANPTANTNTMFATTALARNKVTEMMTGMKVVGSKWSSSSCDCEDTAMEKKPQHDDEVESKLSNPKSPLHPKKKTDAITAEKVNWPDQRVKKEELKPLQAKDKVQLTKKILQVKHK